MNKTILEAEKINKMFMEFLKKDGWFCRGTRHDDNLLIIASPKNVEPKMDFIIRIDSEEKVIFVTTKLPFVMNHDKLLEGSIAINIINIELIDGSFDYDVYSGIIHFRIAYFWGGIGISDEVFSHLMGCCFFAIDGYSDKLQLISNGLLEVADLQKRLN